MSDEVTVSVRIKPWFLDTKENILAACLDFWQDGWYGGVLAAPPVKELPAKTQIQLQKEGGNSINAAVGDVIVKMGAVYEVLSRADFEAKYGLG